MEQLRYWLKGPSSKNQLSRNIWHLYQDLLWLGVTSAASTYVSVYALRLGASDELIGLLTSVPALIVLVFRIPAVRWTERTSNRKDLLIKALIASRVLYLAMALLPLLGMIPLFAGMPQATLLVVIVLLMNFPSAVTQAGWDSFFADIVPDGQRAKVVSVRSTVTSILALATVPLFGLWLDWAAFPLNYQFVFFLAFIGAMVSTWHVHKINLPATATQPDKSAKGLTFPEIKRILSTNKEFSALVLATFIYQIGISLAGPLFTIYYVDHLGASDSWIGWQTTLASLVSIVAYRVWPRQIDKYGDRRIITLTAPLMTLFPLLTGLAHTLTPQLFIVMWPRFFGSAVMLARYSILLRTCPADRRPTYIAIYAMAANVAAFVAPMVAVKLANGIGINNVFFIAAAFRLAAGLLYFRLPKAQQLESVPAT